MVERMLLLVQSPASPCLLMTGECTGEASNLCLRQTVRFGFIGNMGVALSIFSAVNLLKEVSEQSAVFVCVLRNNVYLGAKVKAIKEFIDVRRAGGLIED